MLAISSHAAIAYLRAPAPIMNGAYAGTTPVTAEYVKSLPGVVAPFTNGFDPLGLAPETQEAFLMYREAELAHGRVAMMAALGFFVQEQFHPIFSYANGPVIRELDQVLSTSNGMLGGSILLMAIAFSEIQRARTGWVDPDVEMWALREDYLPGDLGFDPLNLKPKDPKELLALQNKELNNGRLAMIAVAGMTAEELVSGAKLFA